MREELKGIRQLCISRVVLQVTEAIEFLEAGNFWRSQKDYRVFNNRAGQTIIFVNTYLHIVLQSEMFHGSRIQYMQ